MDEMLEQQPEFYDIIPEFNSAGRLCNYHTGGEGDTARVMADEWERFNQLAGRQHEIVGGVVVYNPELEPCMPDDNSLPDPLIELEKQVQAQSILVALSVGAEVEITPEVLEIATAGAPITELTEDEEWRAGVRVHPDTMVTYNGTTYQCIQGHVTQSDWPPDMTPALWKVMANPAEEWPQWVQPTGAHDSYAKGDKVTHNGKHWVSNVDNNVWAPGVYGWIEQV